MSNAVFGKIIENMTKHKDIKLAPTERRKNCLVSERNYQTTKFFFWTSLSNRNKKTKVLMNKPLYLGLSILDLRKLLMYEICYDYVKPKYGQNLNLCYMDTHSFIVYIKVADIYKDIAEDGEIRFDTSKLGVEQTTTKKKKQKSNWIN